MIAPVLTSTVTVCHRNRSEQPFYIGLGVHYKYYKMTVLFVILVMHPKAYIERLFTAISVANRHS